MKKEKSVNANPVTMENVPSVGLTVDTVSLPTHKPKTAKTRKLKPSKLQLQKPIKGIPKGETAEQVNKYDTGVTIKKPESARAFPTNEPTFHPLPEKVLDGENLEIKALIQAIDECEKYLNSKSGGRCARFFNGVGWVEYGGDLEALKEALLRNTEEILEQYGENALYEYISYLESKSDRFKELLETIMYDSKQERVDASIIELLIIINYSEFPTRDVQETLDDSTYEEPSDED